MYEPAMVVLVTAFALFSPARADRSPARAERMEALTDFWDASDAVTDALAALVFGTRDVTVVSVAMDAHRVFFLEPKLLLRLKVAL
jgi:hypothetical protein